MSATCSVQKQLAGHISACSTSCAAQHRAFESATDVVWYSGLGWVVVLMPLLVSGGWRVNVVRDVGTSVLCKLVLGVFRAAQCDGMAPFRRTLNVLPTVSNTLHIASCKPQLLISLLGDVAAFG